MTIIQQLSSQVGDKTEEANRKVAQLCLQTPALLKEIAEGLSQKENNLVADCAEVLLK
ncbi:MAG TPA: hypothetical protein VIK89_00300 [Cytophagaceae bacterium]